MPELGSRQNMTGMETKRARGKCIANALVCQLCWTFLLPLTVVQPCNHSKLWVYQVLLQTLTPSLPPGNRSIMCVDNGTCPPLPRTFLLGEDTSTAIPHRMWRQFCKHQLAILWISSAVGNSGILLCSETNFIFYCTWGVQKALALEDVHVSTGSATDLPLHCSRARTVYVYITCPKLSSEAQPCSR